MHADLPILITGIVANIALGLIVFLRNRRSATNILFFLLSIDIGLWSVANYVALGMKDLLQALEWTRIVMVLALPQAMLFYLLMETLPLKTIPLSKRRLTVLAICGVLTMIVCVSPYLFPSLIFVNGYPSPTPGPAMPLFVLVAVGSVIGGIWTWLRRLRKSTGLIHIQLQIIGIGIGFMFTLILFFNFILVVVFASSSYVAISPLYTLPFVAATAYAIIRHKFLDIRLVIARTVSYTTLISLFGVLYALIFSLTSAFFINSLIDLKFVAVSTIMAILMLLTFPRVKSLIEKVTDAVFFKDQYDAPQTLYRLSQIMARTLRLEDLTHQLLQQINKELHVSQSCIILLHEGHVFTILTEGYNHPPEVPEQAAAHTASLGHIINKEDEGDPTAMMFLEALNVSIIVPLETSQRIIGLLCVGEKLSGELLTAEDINVFQIVAPEAAIAIENSLSYEEIHRFNETLEDEVNRATEDLRQANQKLEQLDKLKDEFVSLASHELRTPLTSIRSYIWMALSGKGGVIPDKQKYYLDRAFISSERLIKLVNDMLNISRIESGRMAIQLARVHVLTLIQTVLDVVQPKINELGLRLDVSSEDNLSDVVADADKVEEVLINFIGNAMKFTPKGGRIRINITQDAAYVRISVTDTGIGISPENVGILFTKFGTIRSGSLPDAIASQSTGLGLYISKSIIAMHGGSVKASSPGLGKGSTFSLTIPIYSKETLERLEKLTKKDGLGMIHASIGSYE